MRNGAVRITLVWDHDTDSWGKGKRTVSGLQFQGSGRAASSAEYGDRSEFMRFKTRLRVTFVVIIVLPLALTVLAFFGIGLYLMNVQKGFPAVQPGYTALTENMQEVVDATDKAFFHLQDQIAKDPSRLADKEYLERNFYNIRKYIDEYFNYDHIAERLHILFELADGGSDGSRHEN